MTDPDQPTAGALDGAAHRLPVRVYYEDTDFTGVVFHGAYVRWFERGRSDCLRLLGVSHAELQLQNAAFTVVRMAIDYRRPARIDDALSVRTVFRALKGPRLIAGQQVLRGTELLAQAEVEAACIDLSGRPRKPPAGLVQALRPMLFLGTSP